MSKSANTTDEDKKTDTPAEETQDQSQSEGFVNTTESIGGEDVKIRRRQLTDEDKATIVEEFNAPGAQVGNIAAKYDIGGEEVFTIVDAFNEAKRAAK